MTRFFGLSLSPSTWVAIGILVVIAAAVSGILTLELVKTQREEAARQEYIKLEQQRAAQAAAVNKKEHEEIKKMPDFRLLRN